MCTTWRMKAGWTATGFRWIVLKKKCVLLCVCRWCVLCGKFWLSWGKNKTKKNLNTHKQCINPHPNPLHRVKKNRVAAWVMSLSVPLWFYHGPRFCLSENLREDYEAVFFIWCKVRDEAHLGFLHNTHTHKLLHWYWTYLLWADYVQRLWKSAIVTVFIFLPFFCMSVYVYRRYNGSHVLPARLKAILPISHETMEPNLLKAQIK